MKIPSQPLCSLLTSGSPLAYSVRSARHSAIRNGLDRFSVFAPGVIFMTIEDVRDIAASGESEGVEFKKSTGELKTTGRTVCAMLNGYGGVVLLGVGNAGNIVGQQVSANTRTKIADMLRRIEPYVLLRPDVVPLDDALSVIVVSVPGGESVPYTYDGRHLCARGAHDQTYAAGKIRAVAGRTHTFEVALGVDACPRVRSG